MGLLIDKLPSCCAKPTKKAVMLLPADAQYQRLSCVKVPKYCSITILPSFNTINAFVLVVPKKVTKGGICSSHHPKVAGVMVCHVLPVVGGKYNVWAKILWHNNILMPIKSLWYIAINLLAVI